MFISKFYGLFILNEVINIMYLNLFLILKLLLFMLYFNFLLYVLLYDLMLMHIEFFQENNILWDPIIDRNIQHILNTLLSMNLLCLDNFYILI